jgi:hypothetical protein
LSLLQSFANFAPMSFDARYLPPCAPAKLHHAWPSNAGVCRIALFDRRALCVIELEADRGQPVAVHFQLEAASYNDFSPDRCYRRAGGVDAGRKANRPARRLAKLGKKEHQL